MVVCTGSSGLPYRVYMYVYLYTCMPVYLFPCLLVYLLYLFPCLSVYLFTGIHLIQKEGMGVWRRRIDTRSRTGTCPRQSLPICPSKGQSETSQLSNRCLKLFEILEYFTWTPSFRFIQVHSCLIPAYSRPTYMIHHTNGAL